MSEKLCYSFDPQVCPRGWADIGTPVARQHVLQSLVERSTFIVEPTHSHTCRTDQQAVLESLVKADLVEQLRPDEGPVAWSFTGLGKRAVRVGHHLRNPKLALSTPQGMPDEDASTWVLLQKLAAAG